MTSPAAQMQNRGVTETICAFATGTAAGDIPKEALETARLLILDTIGIALAASTLPIGRIIAGYVRDSTGPGSVTVLGSGLKVAMPLAALANGTMANALDFDGGWHTTTHEESMDPQLGYQKTVFQFLTIANQTFADFLRRLDNYKEGDKTLLDRTLVLWQTDHGDARTHTIEDIPVMTAGSGGGLIKTGMHIPSPGDPCCRVGLTVQQAMGVPISTWGDMSNQTTKTITEMMA